jgi:hypothetical protein
MWIKQIEQHANTDVEKMLIATKCDHPDKKVDSKKGLELAQ